MRFIVILAFLSGGAAFLASHQALETDSPSWDEHWRFAQSAIGAPFARLTKEEGEAAAEVSAATAPEPPIVQYPVLTGLVSGLSVLALGGLLRLADRLGAT